MKTPIVTIILFLALALGIFSVRILDTLHETEPATVLSTYTITDAKNSIVPSANATEISERPVAEKPDLPAGALTTEDKDELFKLLSSSGMDIDPLKEKIKESAITCEVQKVTSCSKKGCNESKSKLSLELDFSANIYKRCEQNICNTFKMLVNKNKDFSSITVPSNGVAFRISNRESYFSEASSLAGTTTTAFGRCPKAAAYLSAL
jgi:hypothetical protein